LTCVTLAALWIIDLLMAVKNYEMIYVCASHQSRQVGVGLKKDNRRSAEEWYREGQRLALDGNYTEALGVYTLAIEQDRRFADAYFGRGACYYALGDYDTLPGGIECCCALGFARSPDLEPVGDQDSG